uniref:hypothetical protein n=1 Tax=Glutamicibacter protophormiae TaxID=37930 RepID=UPI003A9187D3
GMGRPGPWLALVAIAYTSSTAMLAVGVQFGLNILLLTWVAGAFVESVIRWIAVSRLTGVTVWQAARPLLGALGPSVIAAVVGLVLMQSMARVPQVLTLACVGIVVVLSYLFALRFLRPTAFTAVIDVLPQGVSRPLRWTLPRRLWAHKDADDAPEPEQPRN